MQDIVTQLDNHSTQLEYDLAMHACRMELFQRKNFKYDGRVIRELEELDKDNCDFIKSMPDLDQYGKELVLTAKQFEKKLEGTMKGHEILLNRAEQRSQTQLHNLRRKTEFRLEALELAFT